MKAIVLCAGRGMRLGNLTQDTPKPMLPLNGEPLLAHTLRYLADQGFKDIAINLHFLPDVIPSYFGDGKGFGVDIHYSYEPQLLGTAGAVKNLEPWLENTEDFLVLYGDLLINQDLAPLIDVHRREDAFATLLVHQRPGSNSIVNMDDTGCIIDFIERPTDEQRAALTSSWVNSGVYMLCRGVLKYIEAGRSYDFPRDIFTSIIHHERIFGVPLTGYRCAIDSQERYTDAENAIKSGLYQAGSDTT